MKGTLAAGLLVAALPASFMGYKSFFGCPLSACCGGSSPAAIAVASESPTSPCCELPSKDLVLAGCSDSSSCREEKSASATLAATKIDGEPCEFCD